MNRLHAYLWVYVSLFQIPVHANVETWVPFVIPAIPHADSLIAAENKQSITLDGPRLTITQVPCTEIPQPHVSSRSPSSRGLGPDTGIFTWYDQRLRLWGVNLSFGANFPTHADAPNVAARMAAAGVNTVRLHHMDTAPWPRGLWDPQHPTELSQEALNRLDFFIHELAQHGIHINLNLHVGRSHSRFLNLPETSSNYDKMVNLFTPALIEAQKQFARTLLHHQNPYRQNKRYAEDPAVAIVEITNENSLFMWSADETLRSLPPFYRNLLTQQYNAWLQRRYISRSSLATAWAKDTESLGTNLLANPQLKMTESSTQPTGWQVEQHAECRMRLTHSDQTLTIAPLHTDNTGWHLQINQSGLSLKAGHYYTVVIEATSPQARTIHCTVGQAHSPWQGLGLSRSMSLTPDTQTFPLGFLATYDDINARINISVGNSEIPFQLHRITFHRGGQVGLTPLEDPKQNTVALFVDNESAARQQDRLIFFAETEKAFFDSMYQFIKQDLHCQALVTGTIVFGPLGLYAQSDMDFIDAHAYWQHPHFPGKSWDAGNWLIEQKAMTGYPQEATLFRLAAERLQGKPFTVSEYNHPAPLDSQAECVPLIAAFGAAQDWDGVWLYTYSHTQDSWPREQISSYFDIDSNPAKWGFMRAGTRIFRDGIIGRLNRRALVSLSRPEAPLLPQLAAVAQQHDRDMFAALAAAYHMGRSNLLVTQVATLWTDPTKIFPLPFAPSSMNWFEDNPGGFFGMEGPGALVLSGQSQHFAKGTENECTIQSPAQLTLTLTALDSPSLEASRRLLVTACGRCENTGMVFSEDRRTVGRNWGQAPVQIEPVTGTLILPKGAWSAQALHPDGRAKQPAVILTSEGTPYLKLEARHQTMWYLVERAP